MIIHVKLFATLQKDRFVEKTIAINEDAKVSDLLMQIGISDKDATIIFVNNRHANLDDKLRDSDIVAFFPPIGGGGIVKLCYL